MGSRHYFNEVEFITLSVDDGQIVMKTKRAYSEPSDIRMTPERATALAIDLLKHAEKARAQSAIADNPSIPHLTKLRGGMNGPLSRVWREEWRDRLRSVCPEADISVVNAVSNALVSESVPCNVVCYLFWWNNVLSRLSLYESPAVRLYRMFAQRVF